MNQAERERAEKAAGVHADACFPYNAGGDHERHKVILQNAKDSYLAGYEQAVNDAKSRPNIMPIDIVDRLHLIVDKLTAAERAIEEKLSLKNAKKIKD